MATNVNRPTDIKQKEADINRKLQLYGIISAFRNGKVPSNEQVDVALNSFLESRALGTPSERLSEDGKQLVWDFEEVLKQVKKLILSKNEGNLIQDFIWQTRQFDTKNISGVDTPVDKDTAKRDGQEALQGLRTLGTLLITNGQFRKLLKDASILLRDMAGDAATTGANRVRPSQEQLAQIDNPAEDNTWHDAPNLSKDNLKKQAKGIYSGSGRDDARDVAAAGASAAVNQGDNPINAGQPVPAGQTSTTANQPMDGLAGQPGAATTGRMPVPPGTNQPVDRLAAETGAVSQGNAAPASTDQPIDRVAGQNAAVTVAKQKIDQNLDPETKEKLKKRHEEYRRKTKEYFDKKMPQERKDQIIFRLKKMILECQQHSDYSQAIETLLRLAESYGSRGRALGKDSAGTAKQARSNFQVAEDDLRTLIERFANGTSTSDLWASINQIYRDADQDQELKGWFKSMDKYIRRCLLEQGYILDESSNHEWDQLYQHGRYLLREKYRGHTDRVVDETKFLGDQFDKDPHNKAFAQSVRKLFNHLGHNADGKVVFKPQLVKDLTEVIIPSALENISYVPIPRIEYSDPQFDAVIENLVLESDNFMPNVAEVASEHYFRLGRKKIANKHHNTMDVKVAGIQMDLRDVSYHVKRKSGFPSITDTGVADILLPGNGLSFRMKVATAHKTDRQNFFKVDKVDVDFKGLNIKIKQSSHKLLFGIFKPLMIRVLRKPIQKAVEKAIKDECNKLDQMLFQIKEEADRAAREGADNEAAKKANFYTRYYHAAQKRYMEGKRKTEEVVSDKHVHVAMTMENSLFPNVKLPGGVSSKATEYKELARKGEKWESPVFSIGGASKSNDIPSAPHIEKKPHAAGGNRGASGAAEGTAGQAPQGAYGAAGAPVGGAYDATGQPAGGAYGGAAVPETLPGTQVTNGGPRVTNGATGAVLNGKGAPRTTNMNPNAQTFSGR